MIPPTDMPGAVQARVPSSIDLVVSRNVEINPYTVAVCNGCSRHPRSSWEGLYRPD